MKFSTYYNLYYKWKFKKPYAAKKKKFFLNLIKLIFLPFKYLLDSFFLPPKINLDSYALKNNHLFRFSLDDLFQHFNSDKGSFATFQYMQASKKKKTKIKSMNYSGFYEKKLSKIRNNKLDILEIGNFYGNGIASFYFYFKESNLFAYDIFPDLFRFKSKRIKNRYFNSSSEQSIENSFFNNSQMFDIIIDDASHTYKDQIIAFFMLFKKIKPGGFFVVEDLDVPDKMVQYNPENNTKTLKYCLAKLKDCEDFSHNLINEEDKSYVKNNFLNIDVYMGNDNEIAFIEKKSN